MAAVLLRPLSVVPAKAGISLFFFAPSRLRVRKNRIGSREDAKAGRKGRKGRKGNEIPALAGMTGLPSRRGLSVEMTVFG
jgi:hypothetical protein